MRIRTYLSDLLIYTVFVGLGLFATCPVIFNMTSQIYGYPGDATGTIWYFWWWKYAWMHGISSNFVPILSYPFGLDLSLIPQAPLAKFLSFPLSLVGGEIFAYNFLIILSFPVAAVTMYYLVKRLTQSRPAAVLSGIIFAFSPYHLLHGYGHLNIVVAMQWLPLAVLFLLKLNDRPTYLRAIACAVSLSLVILTDYYTGFFTLFVLGVFLLFRLLYRSFVEGSSSIDLRFYGMVGLVAVISFLIIIPFVYPIIRSVAISTGVYYTHSLEELWIYSARPWDYLLPIVHNPIFGRLVKSFVVSHLHGSNIVEQALYLGFIPMLLAVYGLWTHFRRKAKSVIKGNSFAVLFLVVLALSACVYSGPPYIELANLRIPMPSLSTYKVTPVFRVYARFGLLVLLSVATLAGIGLSQLITRFSNKAAVYAVTTLLILLVCVEFTNVPPFRTFDARTTPPIYRWLAEQPGNFAVVEYPLASSGHPTHYGYMFYQRIHRKSLVNGAWGNAKALAFESALENIESEKTSSILSYLKVKYAIVHLDKYDHQDVPVIGAEKDSGLKLVRQFGQSRVYLIVAKPVKLLTLPADNFGQRERWSDGCNWRWMSNDATLILINNTGRSLSIDINFSTISFAKRRTLDVRLGGSLLRRIEVSPKGNPLQLRKVLLKPGENTIVLHAFEGPQVIDSVLRNGDFRSVSLAFSDFVVKSEEGEK